MVEINNIKRITVVGAGVMGSGIALTALLAGFEKVTLYDLNETILEKSRKSIRKIMNDWKPVNNAKNVLSLNPALLNTNVDDLFEDTENLGILGEGVSKETIMNRLICELELSKALQNADFVIEAVTENLEIKQDIFKKLGKLSPPNTILATNTSTMSITKIGAFSNRKEKVVGMHFHNFFPLTARMMEITPGDKTSKETMDITYAIAKKLPCAFKDKFVVKLEKESPGLIGNRLSLVGSLYMEWIFDQLYEKGITQEQLNTIGVVGTYVDEIGIDVVYCCMKYFQNHVSADFTPGERLTELYNEGRFGKKVGKGYFDWDENGNPIIKQVPIDDETRQFLTSFMGTIDPEIIGAIGLNEACRLLEEGVMKSYNLIDQTVA
ncbi:MAG: 3-hydroxyacyl-CoA dehydrogenase family protein, partial [Promethearchaeota archaeon]